jgi:hypothetical protein
LMRLSNGYIDRRPLMERDGSGVSALVGLDGFVVCTQLLDEASGEWWLAVETTEDRSWCPSCGVRAVGHGRRRVVVRDLPLADRPVVLVWAKHLWRCREPACPTRTWSEESDQIAPRAVLTERARAEIARRVGPAEHSVAQAARDFGVSWHAAMAGYATTADPASARSAGVRLELDGPVVATLDFDELSEVEGVHRSPDRQIQDRRAWLAHAWTRRQAHRCTTTGIIKVAAPSICAIRLKQRRLHRSRPGRYSGCTRPLTPGGGTLRPHHCRAVRSRMRHHGSSRGRADMYLDRRTNASGAATLLSASGT